MRSKPDRQTQRLDRVIVFVRMVLAGIFLVSAASKIFDATPLAKTLEYLFTGTPQESTLGLGLTYAIIAWELFLAILVLVSAGTRLPLVLMLCSLAGFSGVLIVLAQDPDAPSCGCFGVLEFGRDSAAQARLGIIRNTGLILLAGWALFRVKSQPKKPQAQPVQSYTGGARGGFTIIEMLIVMAVVGVILAISLPALAQARLRGSMTQSLSLHRQLLSSVQLHASDHDDLVPALRSDDANPLYGPLMGGGQEQLVGWNYFTRQSAWWHLELIPQYFEPERATWFPGSEDTEFSGVRPTRFFMTYTAFADPLLWENGRSVQPSWLRQQRLSSISFPSSKGLLIDMSVGAINSDVYIGWRTLSIGVADGSATERDWWAFDESLASDPDVSLAWPGPIMATRQGFHGHDW